MNAIAFAGLPGGPEVLVVLFVILLLFGAKKLPELSRSLGRSLGEFKKGKEDLEREIRAVENDLHEVATEEVKNKPTASEKEPAEKPKASSAEPTEEFDAKSESEPTEPDRS